MRHTSGTSRAQLTRLVHRWQANRLAAEPLVKRYGAPAAPFARKFTPGDVTLLVEMDRAHEDVRGPAVAHLLQRAYHVYGDARYARLATLSVSHLYNLRKSAGYRAQRLHVTKTRPVSHPIGMRRAPRPQGRAGFVRIDTVHQGDQDGIKGVYHITCVDAVSQWQVQACVQGMGEVLTAADVGNIHHRSATSPGCAGPAPTMAGMAPWRIRSAWRWPATAIARCRDSMIYPLTGEPAT